MMFRVIFSIFLLSFVVRTIGSILFNLYIWQLKEYRIDRMLSFLRTCSGKKTLLNIGQILKWTVFIAVAIVLFFPVLPMNNTELKIFISVIYFIFWMVWVIEALMLFFRLISISIVRPKLTGKVFLLGFLPAVIYTALTLFYPYTILVYGPLFDRTVFLAVFIMVYTINLITDIYKEIFIFIAARKISKMKNLKVIGITGSFGKTSTKYFLAEMLKGKYKVSVPPKSHNTAFSIARHIQKSLKRDDDYLIVEMGAYRRGEIKKICSMVHPGFSIITGIGNQHLELFGSLENLIAAKSELIENTDRSGWVIFNGNSSGCQKMENTARHRSLKTYSVSTMDVEKAIATKDYLSLSLYFIKKRYPVRINLFGVQNIDNIMLAAKASKLLGLSDVEIIKGMKRLHPVDKTMARIIKGKISLIDDTHNISMDGARSAIDYMKLCPGKKFLVISPVIELGVESDNLHKKLGQYASRVFDMVIYTSLNYYFSFRKGIGEKHAILLKPAEFTEFLKPVSGTGYTVLFEGKESRKYLERLTTEINND